MTTQRDKQLANYGSIRKHESHRTGTPPWDRPDWLASDVLPGGSTLPNHPVMHWRRISRSHMTGVSLTGSLCPVMQHCDSVFLISKSSIRSGRVTQTLKIEQNNMGKIGKAMESCWKGRLWYSHFASRETTRFRSTIRYHCDFSKHPSFRDLGASLSAKGTWPTREHRPKNALQSIGCLSERKIILYILKLDPSQKDICQCAICFFFKKG